MSFTLSAGLQRAVYAHLQATPALQSLISGRLYDSPPHADGVDASPMPYIVLGEEYCEPFDTKTERGARIELTFEIWSRERGYSEAKTLCAALTESLETADIPLDTGKVVLIRPLDFETDREGTGRLRVMRCRFEFYLEKAV